MEETLKKLTDKIYNEGIVKANEEAEAIINEAKQKADALLHSATKQSEEIISDAQNDAGEMKKKVLSELEMTARQSIAAIKQTITDIMVANASEIPVKDAFNSDVFVKDMIITMLHNWNISSENAFFEVLYPDTMKLEEYLKSSISETLKNKVVFIPSKEVESGFTIMSKEDGCKIKFTEESFDSFIKEYIRPKTYELLFKK